MNSHFPATRQSPSGTPGVRIGLAFALAPLATALAQAIAAGSIGWIIVFAPFAYLFSLPGIPAFLLFRKLGWLRWWQVVPTGALLGALVSPLIRPGIQFLSDVTIPAAEGAFTALVFWIIAFAGASSSIHQVDANEA